MLLVMLCKNFLNDWPNELLLLSQHRENILDEGLICTRLITHHYLSFCIGLFDSRVLGRISGTKRQKLTGGCRKLHNEELHNNLCSSPNVSREIILKRKKF
jgi:hypothetical protein